LLARLTAADSGPQAGVGPFSPEESLAHFQLAPEFRIELAAAEPDVIDPVHIAFDTAGRMWVVEYSDYPNGPAEGQPGTSRIRTLTDADGDGRYTDPVVFAEKLLFATGLLPWRDGVIVTSAGSVSFLRDTTGDGRADETQEWFVGFKQENPQLRANHPTFAIDNHIYVASGIRGGEVGPGQDWAAAFGRDAAQLPAPVSLSGRDFRFDPLTGDFEAVTGPGQFGLTFDDWGRRFVCDNRHPCKQIMFEEWHLRGNPQVAIAQTFHDVMPQGEESRLYPLSRTFTTSNLHSNQFTAACGLCIYRGDALPPAAYGNAFVCDPTANLVHRAILVDTGSPALSSRVEDEGREFLATQDEWFRPVNIANGPDGALYVVDMYRAVIEHPQFMPEELKTRPDLLLGTDKGRIYRIVSKDRPFQVPPAANVGALPSPASTPAELARFLEHPRAWQREAAQRLLLESSLPVEEKAAAVRALFGRESLPGQAHAAWLLSTWGQLAPEELRRLLLIGTTPADPGSRVSIAIPDGDRFEPTRPLRETAVRIAAVQRQLDEDTQAVLSFALPFNAPRAPIFEVLLAHATQPALSGVETCLIGLPINNPWILDAARLATRDPGAVLQSYLRSRGGIFSQPPPDDRVRFEADAAETLFAFAEMTGRRTSALEVVRELALAQSSLHESGPASAAVLLGLLAGTKAQRQPVAAALAAAAENPGAAAFVGSTFAWAQRAALDADARRRSDAIALLEFAPRGQAEPLVELAQSGSDLPLRLKAIETLGRRSEPEIDALLIDGLAALSPELRTAKLAAVFQSKARLALLLDEIEAERFPPRLIDSNRAKQLTSHADAAIRERAVKLLKFETPAARQQVLADYQNCLSLESDPRRGEAIFKAQCITCHKIGSLGVNVAPDISDSRVKTREYLLTSILDPNQAIDNNYFSYTVVDIDGVVHTGILATETSTSITLKQPEGKELTIPREQIEQLRSNGVSLMPEGLERNITPQQMADLISFIKNWRYLDGSVPREVIR
jgi:putative membrane-bound dehydrogenase-like protein